MSTTRSNTQTGSADVHQALRPVVNEFLDRLGVDLGDSEFSALWLAAMKAALAGYRLGVADEVLRVRRGGAAIPMIADLTVVDDWAER